MDELKPCPFCGGEADCNNAGFLKNGKPMWAVECLNCGMVTAFFYTDSEAIEAWNKRTERPKGRWIMRGGKRYCSVCQQRACVTRDSDDFWYTAGTDFCPNCGADMRGESE